MDVTTDTSHLDTGVRLQENPDAVVDSILRFDGRSRPG